MDCGHGGVCYECAMEIWKASNECHLCREPIKSVYQLEKKGVGKSKYYCVVAATKRVQVKKEKEKDLESADFEDVSDVQSSLQVDDSYRLPSED